MRIHLNRSLASYRKLIESPTFGDDSALSLARVLLSMIDEPGLWSIDDRGSWIEITREHDADEVGRLRELLDAFGGGG